MKVHQSTVGTYHPAEQGSWTIQDTRGYMDIGPSCDECGACECEHGWRFNECTTCKEGGCPWVTWEEHIGLSFAYVNLDGGETLCEDCATKQGITISDCDCQ